MLRTTQLTRILGRCSQPEYDLTEGPRREMKIVFLGILATIALLNIGLSKWLRRSGDSRLLRSLNDAPTEVRIVVLGCRPQLRSGENNRYFMGRVASAAAAYHHTPGRRILCSGRIDEDGVDEATALADALVTASVPRTTIELDQNSLRTIDSIDHVAARHADEPILLVTQPFHMPRALFLARSRGVDAWGLIAAGPDPGAIIRIREAMAELRAVLDLWRPHLRKGRK